MPCVARDFRLARELCLVPSSFSNVVGTVIRRKDGGMLRRFAML